MNVFLSAGVPDQPARGPYLDTSDPIAIRDAVRALVAVGLSRGHHLVFGGHPAITPLVFQVASALERLPAVRVYQSREYEKVMPDEARRIPNFVWTEKGNDAEHSKRLLREQMLGSHHDYGLGVFIGGMDGVEKEYALFRRHHRRAPALPIGTTGGAAGILCKEAEGLTPQLRERLLKARLYRSLFLEVLS
jgi:hypothetical protein